MSTISNAQAFCGLTAIATPSKTGVTGSLTIAGGSSRVSLPEVTDSYAFTAYIAEGATLALDVLEADFTGTTAWTAGAAQVESAFGSGTVTSGGTAFATVTAAGMAGSPLAVTVNVATSDTVDLWAPKFAAALNADSVVASRFTATASTTGKISLTRKPVDTIDTVNFYADNDATLNIAIASGTCAGIVTATTSTDTTAGVLTEGILLLDGDGNNFQGDAISMSAVQAICFEGFHDNTYFDNASSQIFAVFDGQKTIHMIPDRSLTDYESISFSGAIYESKVIVTVQGVKTIP
jgi:hypothetical protein